MKPRYRYVPQALGGVWLTVRGGVPVAPGPTDPAWRQQPPPVLYPPGYWRRVMGAALARTNTTWLGF